MSFLKVLAVTRHARLCVNPKFDFRLRPQVDVDDQPDIAAEAGVTAMPTFNCTSPTFAHTVTPRVASYIQNESVEICSHQIQ